MAITLRDIDKDNFRGVLNLKVGDGQEGFVAPNVFSIAESKVFPHLLPKAIYSDEQLVGFSLFGPDPSTGRYWLVRFMIDKAHQGKGLGRAALDRLIKEMATQFDFSEIFLSVVPANSGARKLYESSGFVETGEVDEGEIVMRYELAARSKAS